VSLHCTSHTISPDREVHHECNPSRHDGFHERETRTSFSSRLRVSARKVEASLPDGANTVVVTVPPKTRSRRHPAPAPTARSHHKTNLPA
jgi:hypothetical protein